MGAFLAIRAAMSGLKTYFVVGLWFACLIAEKVLGFDVPDFDPGPDWISQAAEMIAFATARAGMAKIGSTAQIIEKLTGR